MPNNLSHPILDPGNLRPHQTGEARGWKWGKFAISRTEWLIDTGAEISVVTRSKGAMFDLNVVAGSASATTGGGGILMKSGLTTMFEVFDAVGSPQQVTCSLDVGVKPNDAGSEILGMDQVRNVGGIVEWDPNTRTGRLRKP